jgi:nucleoside 2-deoxyribosyltransferase
MSKLYYLASPYTHKNTKIMKKRFIDVCKLSAYLLKKGIHTLCPIASSHPTAKYGKIRSTMWKDWAKLDLNFLKRCDGILISVLDKEWMKSIGMKAELEFALKNNIPARLITKDGKILNFSGKEILEMFKIKEAV